MSNNKLFTIARIKNHVATVLVLPLALAFGGCAMPGMTQALTGDAMYQSAVSSGLRTADDKQSDAYRKPLAFLKFAGVRPGMQVMDVSSGGGNTTQLLALAVGSSGKVYAQGQSPRPALDKRLADNPQSNIVVVTRPFEDPVPPGTPPLDLITINLSYHDIANLPIDRVGMDRRLFAALKPGGHLVVIDHASAVGTGVTTTSTLHRIEEAQVRSDFEQAGFRLEQSGDYLRNPADDRSRKTAEMEHTTDRFALRFVKP